MRDLRHRRNTSRLHVASAVCIILMSLQTTQEGLAERSPVGRERNFHCIISNTTRLREKKSQGRRVAKTNTMHIVRFTHLSVQLQSVLLSLIFAYRLQG